MVDEDEPARPKQPSAPPPQIKLSGAALAAGSEQTQNRRLAPNAADFGELFSNREFWHSNCACEVGSLRICHYC